MQGLFRRYPAMQYEKYRHLLKKIQNIRKIVHRTMMPQSPSKQVPWNLTQFSQLLSAALSYFPESHPWSEISSLSKVVLVSGKARSHRAPNLGCRRCWITWVIWYFTKKLWTRCDVWAGTLFWWSCQSPVAQSCSLLNHLSSFHGGLFKLNTRFDADSLLYLLSHFECNSHMVHMLTQQCLLPPLSSTVKSSLFTQVHSSPLSLIARLHRSHANLSHYINNGWTFSGQTLYMSVSILITHSILTYYIF